MSANILSTLELTGTEKAFCTYGGWLTICHAAHLTGDQSVIVKNIHHVIPHLLKRHPRMRSRLHIDGYQHLLQLLDYDEKYLNPNLFYSIIETNDQSWQKIVENECHRNPYSDNGKTIFPLFHFMLILSRDSQSSNDNLFHLLLFSNHCASDGRSGYILMNDFLTLITSSDLHERTESVNTEVIPCITQLMPRPYGLLYPLVLFIGKQIYKKDLQKLNHPRIPVKTTVLTGESASSHFQPITLNFLFTSSSSTLYSRLREKCHSQQITLHGPLLGCLFLAVHHCFPVKNKNDRYLTATSTDLDFDMRSRLPQSPLTPKTVAFCVGICPVEIKQRLPLISTPFWTLAKKCVEITRKVINDGDIHLIQHCLKDIMVNEQRFNKFLNYTRDGRVSEMNFSNIGKYPYSCDYNQGQLRIRGLHVTNNACITHSSVVLLVSCVGDGQLDVSLAHEMESEEKGQEFLNYYVRLIEACADADVEITLQQLLTNVQS